MPYKLKPIEINAMKMNGNGSLEINGNSQTFDSDDWLVQWPTSELEFIPDAKFKALTGDTAPKVKKERKPRAKKNGMAGTVLGTEERVEG